jgi:hypothetical protein
MRAVVVVTLVCLACVGCRAGFKSAAGGATSPTGFGRGLSRSVVFSDEGGLLSRLGLGIGLGGLGVITAAGAVENAQTKTSVDTNGDRTVVTQETTGTVNQQQANDALKITQLADGAKLSGKNGGLAANLEIAAQTLGGDTSGWQYDMGYSFRRVTTSTTFALGFRGYIGVGYGSFTMHDRIMERVDRGPPEFGEATFTFLGLPTRFGVFLVKRPEGLTSLVGTETFVKANINASGPTVFHLGQRLQMSLLFVEAGVSMSGTAEDDRSYELEVGLGF